MPITVAQAEAELIERTSDLLALVGLSTLNDGSNPSIRSALYYGIGVSGGSAASWSSLTDGDLLTVADHGKMLDFAEYRLLVTCRNRWVQVRNRMGAQSEVYWNQIRESLQEAIDSTWSKISTQYGVGLGTIEGSVITLPIASTDPSQDQEL